VFNRSIATLFSRATNSYSLGSMLGAAGVVTANYLYNNYINSHKERSKSHNRQPLTDSQLIDGLRENIKRNSKLPESFHEIDTSTPEKNDFITRLMTAINNGDFESDAFKRQDSLKHILYLIERQMIPFWHGMTAYVRVLAHLQCVAYEPLPGFDEKVVSHSQTFLQASCLSMVENNHLTPDAQKYIAHLCKNFKSFGFDIDIDDLTKFVLSSPPIEQCLIIVKYNGSYRQECFNPFDSAETYSGNNRFSPISFVVRSLVRNNLLCRDEGEDVCNIPSATFMNYIFSKMSSQPMRVKPILGQVNEDTLNNLHSYNQHPAALYCPEVKSNLIQAHNHNCGPLFVWLHDITHVFMANLLTVNEREIIYDQLLPLLQYSKKKFWDINARSGINRLIDLDLSDITEYIRNEDRFERFLLKTMSNVVFLKIPDNFAYKHVMDVLNTNEKLTPYQNIWKKLDDQYYSECKKPLIKRHY
jgi:hypothetical protein